MARAVTQNEVKKQSGPGCLGRFKTGVKKAVGMNIILCESCKWNWRSACYRPERPNATWCPDYVKKGR